MCRAVSKPSIVGICASSRIRAKSSTSSCLSAVLAAVRRRPAATGRPCRMASSASRLSRRSSTSSTLAGRPVVTMRPFCVMSPTARPSPLPSAAISVQQFVEVDRLGDVVAGPGGQGRLAVAGHRLGGQEHHRQVGEAPVAPDRRGWSRCRPGRASSRPSARCRRSGCSASSRMPVGAVVGVEHRHAVQLQRAGQGEDVAHVVVDDEHGDAVELCAAAVRGGGLRGRQRRAASPGRRQLRPAAAGRRRAPPARSRRDRGQR